METRFNLEQVIIRSAVEADLAGMEWDGQFQHYRRVYRQMYAEQQSGLRVLLVAEAGARLVGQVFIQMDSLEKRFADGARRGYLYSLRVRPECRGRGLGAQLVLAAEARLRQRGFRQAVIAVGKENAGALRLYQRLGYQIFGDDPGVWYFTSVNGEPQHIEEPCWMLEKTFA